MEEEKMDDLVAQPSESPLEKLISEAEKETPSESSTEQKPTELTQSSEGEHTQDDNKIEQLNKDSRFKEVIRQKNEFKQRYEETTQKLDEMSRQFGEMQNLIQQRLSDSTQNPEVTIPNEFVDIYGSNEPRTFQEWKKLVDGVVSERIQHYESTKVKKEEERLKKDQEFNSLVEQYRQKYDEEIGQLTKDNGIDFNAFKAWFRKNPIMNEAGSDYDFERSVKLYLLENPKKHSRRELGEKPSYSESGSERKVKTLDEIAKMSWNQIGK